MNRCSVCAHPEYGRISAELLSKSNRRLAKDYGLSEGAVRRHKIHVARSLIDARIATRERAGGRASVVETVTNRQAGREVSQGAAYGNQPPEVARVTGGAGDAMSQNVTTPEWIDGAGVRQGGVDGIGWTRIGGW